jgi:hypothetical protein
VATLSKDVLQHRMDIDLMHTLSDAHVASW